MTARVVLGNQQKNAQFKWEIVPENWFVFSENYTRKLLPEKINIENKTLTDIKFLAPNTEGPYRLHYSIEGENGFVATANIPFYVMSNK